MEVNVSEPNDTVSDAAAEHLSAAAEKVSEVTEQAIGVAREAGKRARTAAESTYGQGRDLLEGIEEVTRQNPLRALLVAGAIGFRIGYLARRG
jgi:ElaB/YqjD/DUF883 family membrane-anchored ribosome-binding protein